MPEPVRYVLWTVATLIEIGTPVVAYSRFRSVPGHASAGTLALALVGPTVFEGRSSPGARAARSAR